eukprot:TRINITY_DN25503_c0_g1_i1.p2 TRINITY_DN25503_c0_g1~~TRINITY_DN25503_c0_g1_i1.p2  ORF type:complete len:348 (+),score=52.60 TRINITY_DN25503_c0_g1_i1:123-1166(+)
MYGSNGPQQGMPTAYGHANPQHQPPEEASSHPSDKYFLPLNGIPKQYFVQCADDKENHKFKFAVRAKDEGVRIIDITPGGPYHRAGVPCGLLVSINDTPIETREQVTEMIQKLQANGVTRFPVMVIRDPSLPAPPAYDPRDYSRKQDPQGAAADGRQEVFPFPMAAAPEDALESTEEFLTRKLNRAAVLHSNGELSAEQYRAIKAELMGHLQLSQGGFPGSPPAPPGIGGGAAGGLFDSFAGPSRGESRPPACTWAETNVRRYVFLRDGPGRGAKWVPNGGVFGVMKVLHVTDGWAKVRDDSNTEGYLRERYLRYLPQGPKSARLNARGCDRPPLPQSPGYDDLDFR